MTGPVVSLLRRCLPRELRGRLAYTEQLDTDLFVSLPPSTKRLFISQAFRVLGYPTFIETGTFLGHTALHASELFETVHTVEMHPWLARRAARLLKRDNVFVHEGDSGTVLRRLLPEVNTPCVFWLDAHYSGGTTARGNSDTPVLDELEAIALHSVRPHAVLIDDARVFGTDGAYPCLVDVIERIRAIDPSLKVGVASDIIWAAREKLLDFQWCMTKSGVIVPPSTAEGRDLTPTAVRPRWHAPGPGCR